MGDPNWRYRKALGHKVVKAKKGKGSYTRKGKAFQKVASGYKRGSAPPRAPAFPQAPPSNENKSRCSLCVLRSIQSMADCWQNRLEYIKNRSETGRLHIPLQNVSNGGGMAGLAALAFRFNHGAYLATLVFCIWAQTLGKTWLLTDWLNNGVGPLCRTQ